MPARALQSRQKYHREQGLAASEESCILLFFKKLLALNLKALRANLTTIFLQ
jgi:hypothetical protein